MYKTGKAILSMKREHIYETWIREPLERLIRDPLE